MIDRGLADRQRDAGLLELLEALQLRGDAVGAERQQRRAIEAAFVGDDDALVAGVDVGDGDGHAGQHRALVVLDRAFDGAVDRRRLREGRRADGETENERRENAKHGGKALQWEYS